MSKKNDILNAALELFNSSNLKAITTNHIAKDISISPGNLYYHYKNKEEIIYDLFNHFSNKHLDLCYKYRDIDDVSLMSNFYDEYFQLVWEYRFINRESYYLCSSDSRFKELFKIYRSVEVKEIYNTAKNFRDRGVVPYISDNNLLNNANTLSILLSNIINYDFNLTLEEWKSNTIKYKELIFYIHSRR